jgi:hypothetical protein
MSRSFESKRAPEPVGAFPHAKRIGNFHHGRNRRRIAYWRDLTPKITTPASPTRQAQANQSPSKA